MRGKGNAIHIVQKKMLMNRITLNIQIRTQQNYYYCTYLKDMRGG
jgi:hypothetical protein